jgi:hypothetical protein
VPRIAEEVSKTDVQGPASGTGRHSCSLIHKIVALSWQDDEVLSDEVASALGPFFDQRGPSHDEITVLIKREGLIDLDPSLSVDRPVGKMKRVRGVLFAAAQDRPSEGERLVRSLVDSVRANGGFRPGNENCPGETAVDALRAALRNMGGDLDADGNLRPAHLESLDGKDLTEALQSYVRRARRGGWDAALVLGTVKSLEEAAARHVLKERTGSYPSHVNFPATMYAAYTSLGLSIPSREVIDSLPKDPRQAVQQAVFLLSLAVNRFRNAEGEGHGRPETATTTAAEVSVLGLAAALVTEVILDAGGLSTSG